MRGSGEVESRVIREQVGYPRPDLGEIFAAVRTQLRNCFRPGAVYMGIMSGVTVSDVVARLKTECIGLIERAGSIELGRARELNAHDIDFGEDEKYQLTGTRMMREQN